MVGLVSAMDLFFGRDPAISWLHLIAVDYTIIDDGDHPGLQRTATLAFVDLSYDNATSDNNNNIVVVS